VALLRAAPEVISLVARHHAAGSLLAAICAAPTVLHDVGLLVGRRYTAHPSVAGELREILGDERVVRDGLLVTSRGAGTAIEFGLELVSALLSPDKAAEIAAAIRFYPPYSSLPWAASPVSFPIATPPLPERPH
jgi:4-methyl-5(b-hydroxyethyl)-thiazole monophosphate biosynthesis